MFLLTKTLSRAMLINMAFFSLLFAACENPFMKDILEYKTVKFNSNGGSSVPSQNMIKGQKIQKPDDPVKTNFVFVAWYVDNDSFVNEWDFDAAPTKDMTLHAKWRSYGITLSPAKIDFDTQEIGYTSILSRTVQVTNTGDEPTGDLTIKLSGTNADDFILSGNSMASLNPDETNSFTVVPIDGLPVGTYTAAVTVSNGSNISAQLNVAFTVTGIPLTITSAAHTKPYDGSTAAAGVTVTLSGIRPEDDVQVGAVAANYTSANAGTQTLNITGVTLTGSAAGKYAVSVPMSVTLTSGGITKAAGSAVTTPSVVGNPADLSITVSTTHVSNTGQTFEYAYYTVPSVPTSGWQTGNTFTLPTDALYYVFARTASNTNYNTGEASASTPAAFYNVTFDKNGGDTEANPQSKYVFYNNTLTAPAAPTRAGYTFSGWYKEAALSNQWNFAADTVSASGTLFAKWVENKVITISVDEITEGVSITDTIEISRTGAVKTYTVAVSSPSDYSSITWEIAGVGAYAGQTISVTGASIELDAENVRYNSLGLHILRLTVIKGGLEYRVNINFTIVE